MLNFPWSVLFSVQVRVKNSTSQLENLKGEKFIQETLKNEKEKEIQLLKQKIKENEDYSRKILNDLEQAKLEARKQGALTLEMRDYEVRNRNIFVDQIRTRTDDTW